MATSILYPENAQLQVIEQKFIQATTTDAATDPIWNHAIIEPINAAKVMWDQLDNYAGRTQHRGIGGEPARVNPVGVSRYEYRPYYMGEFLALGEQQLTESAEMGTWATTLDWRGLSLEKQRQLLTRRVVSWRSILWNLLTYGQYNVFDPRTGQMVAADGYTPRTYAAAFTWSNAGSSTPLADLRNLKYMQRGFSTRFDRTSTLYVNQKTANNALLNTNTADLYGRRVEGLATVNTLDDFNKLLTKDDLPNIQVHDEVWNDDTNGNAATLYIPDNTGIVIGRRTTGVPLIKFFLTRNMMNLDFSPGAYSHIIDTRMFGKRPGEIQVHDGYNGGPANYFPSSCVVMSL